MSGSLGKEVPQPPKTEIGARPPEIKTNFENARKLGVQLTNIDQARRSSGSASFRDDPLLGEFSSLLVDVPDGELTDEKVLDAQRGSFGLTLAGAKQIKNRELFQPNTLRDDMESLTALISNISNASDFAEKLRAINPTAYSEVAKRVVAAELGGRPEEVVINEDNLAKWVRDTYGEARGMLIKKADALSEYLR